MYKILIVDDEQGQVEAMVHIIQKIRPDYEIFEAYDGKEAIDIVLSKPIDFVITDIKMPLMDGLELGEKLIQIANQVKIAILSGYGDFEYTQKSMRLGIFDYLLKPVSKVELENLLNRLEKSITQMREEQAQKESIQKKLDSFLPIYLQHLMNKWIKKNISSEELKEIESIFRFKGKGIVIATRLSKYDSFTKNLKVEEIDNILYFIKYSMKETLNPIGHSISFFLEGNNNVMITIINSLQDFHLFSHENLKKLNELVSRVKTECEIVITIGLGDKSENIFENAAECFEQAYKALEYSFFTGIGNVIAFEEIKRSRPLKSFNIYDRESELRDAFIHINREKALNIFNEIFKNAADFPETDVQNFKEHIINIIINQVKLVSNFIKGDEQEDYVNYIKRRLSQCEEYSEIRHIINEILSELTSFNSKSDKNQLIMHKCKTYMEENYMEDISLESIADKFHFNPSYFSYLFKTYIGTGFTEYLLKVRIREAQELLKNTDIKVFEVTNKVGYKDSAYFIKIFKREVGISPYKFRQISGR